MARAAEMQSEMRIGLARERAAARMHARMHARVDDGLKKLSWCACWLGAAWPGAAALLAALVLAASWPPLLGQWQALAAAAWMFSFSAAWTALPGLAGLALALVALPLAVRRAWRAAQGRDAVPAAYDGLFETAGVAGAFFLLLALALAAAGALGWPVKAVWQHRALWPAGVLLPWAFVSAELAEWFGAGREGRSMQEKSAR